MNKTWGKLKGLLPKAAEKVFGKWNNKIGRNNKRLPWWNEVKRGINR